jgi:eukaryotic-like serine/threonine-protein kinase
MSLHTGARLGPYEITGSLGAGGMGEVYRARDTKLGRDVALKVLPESFAADPDRLARFRREAQLLASMNHPHIGAIYGLEDGDRLALVLELVEGPTLADRIAQGPVPVDEALAIARQIAAALEAAHENGIIHRDLKPANIKLTTQGAVKVLDFGLAKLIEAGDAHGVNAGPASLSPTMLSPAAMTHAGVILGTAAYMSPEQARGKPVDRRVDIWAFGCVLFEMLTGRTPFDAGETVSDAVAAVLRSDPDWLALPAGTPAGVRTLIRRCLEKDPQARVAHIAVARYELDRPPEPVEAPAGPTASSSAGRLAWLAAAAIAGVLVTGLAAWRLIPDPPTPAVTRFSVPIMTEIQVPNAPTQILAISRDGRQIVYGGSRLYRRLLSEREAVPIAGTEATLGSASQPVFSPDGASIAFVTGSPGRASLKRIDLGGGPAVTLTDVLLVLGMSWDASGILYAEARRGIVRISPAGGQPEVLVAQDANKPGEQSFQGPRMLPDGKTLIYGVVGASLDFDDAQIVAQRIGSSERRVLVRGGIDARYLPTGHLVYASRGVLYAVPFDVQTLTVGERPVPIVQGVMGTPVNTTGSAFYDVSDNGTLWYVPGGTTAGIGRTLMAIDRSGAMQPMKIAPGAYEAPRLSPDGRLVAFELADGSERNIWVYDMSGASSMRRLTFGGSNRFPVWTADGRRVTYQSTRDGDSAIYWQLADGTGPAERLTTPTAGEAHVPEAWSPAGDVLLLESRRQDTITLQVLSMRERALSRFGSLESTFPFGPTFSPDGRWIAYSTLAGDAAPGIGVVTNAVFVEPFPPTGAKYQVSRDDDGHHPVWTADGRELIYTRGPGQVAAVAITTAPTFSFSEPVPLGAGMMSISPAQRRGHDPMPDGRRFVAAITARADGGPADVVGEVVVNWFEELKRLVER